MNIPRILYFSKKEEEEANKEENKKIIGGVGMATSGAIISRGMKQYGKKAEKDLILQNLLGETNLRDALVEKAKEGVTVIEDPRFDNSAVVPKSVGKLARFFKKHMPEEKVHKKLAEKLKVSPETIKKISETKKVPVILGRLKSDAALAHELGHAHYLGGGKGIIGKIAHKTSPISNLAGSKLGTYGGGMVSGISSVKEGSDGKIEVDGKKLLKHAGLAVALQAPLLVAEGLASKKGIHLLKNVGAKEEAIKEAREILGPAFKTYVAGAAQATGRFISGQGIGVAAGVAKNKLERENDII